MGVSEDGTAILTDRPFLALHIPLVSRDLFRGWGAQGFPALEDD